MFWGCGVVDFQNVSIASGKTSLPDCHGELRKRPCSLILCWKNMNEVKECFDGQ